MTGCPGSTAAGCRCPQHHPGLLAYSRNPDELEGALDKLRAPVRLTVVTMPDENPCDGTMTCACRRCVRERGTRRPAPAIRQPWEPRPTRRAA